MKKIRIFSLFSFIFIAQCFWQNIPLWNIQFCNNWEITNELDLTVKAGENAPICIVFTNPTSKDITINVDFLDAIITQDQFKNRACNAPDKPKQNFGNFVTSYNKNLTITWNSSIQKIYTIKPSPWASWILHGCIAYNRVETNEETGGSMLNVIVRKVKFIDIFVWATKVQSQIILWSAKIIKNGKTTNIKIWLKNIWNISQKATISWTISNIFWFKQILKFDKNTIDILSNEEVNIQTNNEDMILPAYKWFFTVDMEITNAPIFDFNITNANIPKEIVLGGKFNISKIIFIPNIYLIWIGILLLLLILFRIKKK